MDMDNALQTFYAEADELLGQMELALLRLEDGESDEDTLNEIFRAAHTIKGSGGIFGLEHIVSFTHVVENVLDRVRDNQIQLEKKLIELLFKCRDHIADLVHISPESFTESPELQKVGVALLERLGEWTDTAKEHLPAESLDETAADSTAGEVDWYIRLQLSSDCLRNGMDPISFINYLKTIGEIRSLKTTFDGLPELDSIDPEELYLSFEIILFSDADKETIESTFMFVADDSDIEVRVASSTTSSLSDNDDGLKHQHKADKLGEILVQNGDVTRETLSESLTQQAKEFEAEGRYPKLGELLVDKKGVSKLAVDKALQTQQKSQSSGSATSFVRVDSARLDLLINLIGELVISKQRVDSICEDSKDDILNEAIETLGDHTEALRDAALDLRMVPIGETFQRFRRIVRDTAQELGKDIQLNIHGAETELDRLMVEKLGDPLMHIVRNAMDHGIESTEDRKAAGKSETGNLTLSAYHDAGNVVIEINDDGGGLNKQRILQKAITQNLIQESDNLSDSELYGLIFHPGFSTAEQVTNLSGRGVGMDVVNRNVQALQGNIEVQSEAGAGSTFSIRLPLTLAIIDGFQVKAGGTQFIIPQNTVIECMNMASFEVVEQRHCVNLRGEMIPYVALRELFLLDNSGNPDAVKVDKNSQEMVVVQFGEERAGLIVDDLKGEIQTVVKPLGTMFQALRGIGGSTLLGNGDIAFILDVPQLIEAAVKEEHKASSKHNWRNNDDKG